MKLLTCISALLLTITSFSTLSAVMGANEVDNTRASNMQSMGVVSFSGLSGSPDDAIDALKQKATKNGATHFRIINLHNPGDSSHWTGSAEIYR